MIREILLVACMVAIAFSQIENAQMDQDGRQITQLQYMNEEVQNSEAMNTQPNLENQPESAQMKQIPNSNLNNFMDEPTISVVFYGIDGKPLTESNNDSSAEVPASELAVKDQVQPEIKQKHSKHARKSFHKKTKQQKKKFVEKYSVDATSTTLRTDNAFYASSALFEFQNDQESILYSYYDEDLNILDINNMPLSPKTLIHLDYGILSSNQADETIDDQNNSEFVKVDFVDFNAYKSAQSLNAPESKIGEQQLEVGEQELEVVPDQEQVVEQQEPIQEAEQEPLNQLEQEPVKEVQSEPSTEEQQEPVKEEQIIDQPQKQEQPVHSFNNKESLNVEQEQSDEESVVIDQSQFGDCIKIFSKCNFQGDSLEACDSLSEISKFKHQIHSLYIPPGLSLTIYQQENFSGEKTKFTESQPCLIHPVLLTQLSGQYPLQYHRHLRH